MFCFNSYLNHNKYTVLFTFFVTRLTRSDRPLPGKIKLLPDWLTSWDQKLIDRLIDEIIYWLIKIRYNFHVTKIVWLVLDKVWDVKKDYLTHCLRTGLTMIEACWFTSYNNYHKKIIDRLSQWPATILKSWLIKSTLQRKTVRNHSHLSISGALNAMPNRDILQR